MRAATLLLLAALAGVALADVYMHNPRGSNNRLNERSANRNNGNRMFDSQNNNRGGYNKGDSSNQAAQTEDQQYDFFFYMSAKDYESDPEQKGRSILQVEWTNQHGCGGNEHSDPQKTNCNLLLQYMCVPDEPNMVDTADRTRTDCDNECFFPRFEENPNCDPEMQDKYPCFIDNEIHNPDDCELAGGIWDDAIMYDKYNCPHKCNSGDSANKADCGEASWETHNGGDLTRLRDGLNTNRPDFTNPANGALTEEDRFERKQGNYATANQRERGLHESWEWYDECYRRERNRGLFTADQNLRNNALGYSSAVFTRQNPNNNRRGYECPEERDYWPYWHPSPWTDIVVMTGRTDLCPFYKTESQNVKGKGICRNTEDCTNCIRYNTKEKCLANEGRWVIQGPHGVAAPECIQAPWSRVNHLGNGRDGQANHYNWTLPYISLGNSELEAAHRCVLRLRYNMSTDDYDAWKVNASFNNNQGQGVVSPVRQNPNVDIGAKNTALRLAINTAQFGRTFQDRSHVFRLVPRSSAAKTRSRPSAGANGNDDDFFGKRTLYNLNVRGKRGNIVQTFPSVEYDFIPNHLHIKEADLVHIQWAGSNTHNNGNPAGDGQAGDAGEGRGGTDRHNFVELDHFEFARSFPSTWEQNTIFANMLDALDATVSVGEDKSVQDHRLSVGLDEDRDWEDVKRDWALRMATVGYFESYDAGPNSFKNKALNNNERAELQLLNDNRASYEGGVFRFRRGTYAYMCTRNHNFSNRDQKGLLVVDADDV